MKKAIKASILILAAVILILPLCGCKVYEPAVKYGEFPFVLEYAKDGKCYLIRDTLTYTYNGHNPLFPTVISWKSSTKNQSGSLFPVLKEFGEGIPSLFDEDRYVMSAEISFYVSNGHYYMGDPDNSSWRPKFMYVERFSPVPDQRNSDYMYIDQTTLEELFGIKILRLEYSAPIENEYIEIGEVFKKCS